MNTTSEFVQRIMKLATTPMEYDKVLVTKFIGSPMLGTELELVKVGHLDFINDFEGVMNSSAHIVVDLSYNGEFKNDVYMDSRTEFEWINASTPIWQGDRVVDSNDDVYMVRNK